MVELSQSVRLETEGDVALVVVNNPPVNALSWHVRQGLFDGLTKAVEDGAKAIVVICDGRTFIAGADISEFGGGAPEAAGLPAVQKAMENASVPVIAAIHGTALGGGLEVALCAHYRVSLASAKFGLPEVNLGLLPGAGGTQRLPRLTGVPKALEMMTSGRHIGTGEALECGLVDEVADGGLPELRTAAIAFAERAVAENLPLAKVRDRDEKVAEARGNEQVFADFRRSIARKTRGFLAPEYNVRCVEAAANLPFDEGLKEERRLFTELMTGPQSGAQRYYFFAERAANKIPDVPKDTPLVDIARAGVLGAGTMGGGIAMNFANAGIPVTIVERDQAALDQGLAVVRKNYERSRSTTAEQVEQRMSLITGSTDKADFADCDIVIEAVFEDMGLKQTIFRELDRDLQARSRSGIEHVGTRHQRDRLGDEPARQCDRDALLLARQRHETVGSGSGRHSRPTPWLPPQWRSASRSRRWRYSSACATDSSVTGCCSSVGSRPINSCSRVRRRRRSTECCTTSASRWARSR